MLRYLRWIIISIVGLLVITACSQQEPIEEPLTDLNGSSFLLMADEDPLGVEEGPAFVMDAIGPMYFGVLDLTDEQIAQIREIAAKYRDEFRALMREWKDGKSWKEIRKKRRELHEKMRREIEQILTDEQKAILEEIRTQLANGEYPDIIIEKRVAFLTEQLHLSEEQQEAIRGLLKEYGNKLLAARNNSRHPGQFGMAMMRIFKELDAKIIELLTPDQLVLYNQLKEWHRFKGRRHYDYQNWPGRP
ncbi:MAG TPA: hypothetical protein EYP36_00750 [Calditrichaeota bacterium]|nr:hypothetical protein [Calditrichota bacterium]